MNATTLFFAKAQGSPEGALIVFLVMPALFLYVVIDAIRGGTRCTRINVVIRGHLPFCPRCNRQVSYRRNYCRACGFDLTVTDDADAYPPTSAYGAARARYEAARARRDARRAAEREERLARAAESRRWAWDYFVRFGWYRSLPEFAQPIAVGVAIALPAVLLVAWALQPAHAPAPAAAVHGAPRRPLGTVATAGGESGVGELPEEQAAKRGYGQHVARRIETEADIKRQRGGKGKPKK